MSGRMHPDDLAELAEAVADLVVDRLRAELDGLRSLEPPEPSCVNGGDQHMLTVPQLLRCPCRGCAEYLDYHRLKERSRPVCVHGDERVGLSLAELKRCPCGMCAHWVALQVRRSKLGVVGVSA